MSNEEVLLVDAPLAPDPDADEELGPRDAAAIADEDVRGSRLLLVRRAAESIEVDGAVGGAVQIACTFQPTHGSRFVWARLLLRLQSPEGIYIVDLAPREALDEPVQFTVDNRLNLGVSNVLEVGTELGVQREFAAYHCRVQGSGESTALARWDFSENPGTRAGLGREQVLSLTLPATGEVAGTVRASARLSRGGLLGGVDAVRDLILGPHEGQYPIRFVIPRTQPPTGSSRFLRLP